MGTLIANRSAKQTSLQIHHLTLDRRSFDFFKAFIAYLLDIKMKNGPKVSGK